MRNELITEWMVHSPGNKSFTPGKADELEADMVRERRREEKTNEMGGVGLDRVPGKSNGA